MLRPLKPLRFLSTDSEKKLQFPRPALPLKPGHITGESVSFRLAGIFRDQNFMPTPDRPSLQQPSPSSSPKLPGIEAMVLALTLTLPHHTQEPDTRLENTIEPRQTTRAVFLAFVAEHKKFLTACENTANLDTMQFLDETAKTGVIYELENKRRRLEMSLLKPDPPATASKELKEVDDRLRALCEDRTERFKAFNEMVSRGTIHLETISTLRGNARYAAQKELISLFERNPELRGSFLRVPNPDFVRDQTPVGTGGTSTGRGNDSSPWRVYAPSGVIGGPAPARGGADPVATLLGGDNSLPTTIAALNAVTDRLAARFPHQADFDKVAAACGISAIDDEIKSFVSSSFAITDPIVAGEARDRELKNRDLTARRLPALARDLVERYQALEQVLQNPDSRAALFRELTDNGRTTSRHTKGFPAHSEPAQKYDARIGSLIRLLQSSPHVIEAAAITPPKAPIRQIDPPKAKTTLGAGRSAGLESAVVAAPTGREHTPQRKSAEVTYPRPNPELAGIRGAAEEASKIALTKVLTHALGTQMYTPLPGVQDPTTHFLLKAADASRVQDNRTSDYLATQRLVATNKALAEVHVDGSPFRRLSVLKIEMHQELALAEKSSPNPSSYEAAVLRIRDRYAVRAEAIVRADIPLLNPEDHNFPELLLSSQQILDRKRLFIKNLEWKAAQIPDRTEAPPLGRGLPAAPAFLPPADEKFVLPKLPEIARAPEPDPEITLDLSTRVAINYLQPTMSSMILIEGQVNGAPIVVLYDTVKQELRSDRGMFEASGVRFVDTGEKGQNGMPKVRIDFTMPGTFKVDYRGNNGNSSIAKWSGTIAPKSTHELNMRRLNECQAAGVNKWNDSLASAAFNEKGEKFSYAYSASAKRLFARAPDGKTFFAYHAETNSWHSVPAEKMPKNLLPT